MDKRFPVNEKKQPELDETINFGFASRRSPVRSRYAPSERPCKGAYLSPSCAMRTRPRRGCRLGVGEAQACARPVGHPPVGVAEPTHQCGHEQGADDRGVEDDPGGNPDRKGLDLV